MVCFCVIRNLAQILHDGIIKIASTYIILLVYYTGHISHGIGTTNVNKGGNKISLHSYIIRFIHI